MLLSVGRRTDALGPPRFTALLGFPPVDASVVRWPERMRRFVAGGRAESIEVVYEIC